MAGIEINHLQISVKAYPIASGYADDIATRIADLHTNMAPYEETIQQINTAIDKVDKETEMLYNRIADLEEQRTELLDVGDEAAATRDNIVAKHTAAMAEANTVFFTKLSKLIKVDALADLDRSWSVDMSYADSFGVIYICEDIPEAVAPSDDGSVDDGLSNWMDDINN